MYNSLNYAALEFAEETAGLPQPHLCLAGEETDFGLGPFFYKLTSQRSAIFIILMEPSINKLGFWENFSVLPCHAFILKPRRSRCRSTFSELRRSCSLSSKLSYTVKITIYVPQLT